MDALTKQSAGDRVVGHDGVNLISVGDFVQRTIEAPEAAIDPDPEQKGILHRVPLNASVQIITSPYAIRAKKV